MLVSYAFLALIVALAAYLRFRNIEADGLSGDEAASWNQAQGNPVDIIVATARDNYPPLHNLLLALSMAVFGDAEWALRLPSAIMGILNVVATYWVGTLLSGRKVGLLAAFLLALSSFHIWYSQETRMYALLALTATLFAGAAFQYARTPTRRWAIAAVLAGVALLYSHPFGALTWASIAVPLAAVAFWQPSSVAMSVRRWLILQAIVVAAFLPWAWILLERTATIAEHGFWIEYPTLPSLAQRISRLVAGPPMLFVICIGALAMLVRQVEPEHASNPAMPPLRLGATPDQLVLLAWALGPLLIGYIASVTIEPIIHPRYLIGSLPAIFLIAAVGLTRFAAGLVGTAAAFLLAAGASWVGITSFGPDARDDWRGVGQLLEETLRPSDCLLSNSGLGTLAIRYYYRQPVECYHYAPSPDRVPRDLPSKIAVVVLDRARQNAGIVQAFRSPPWQLGAQVPFRDNIEVFALVRP
jgi:mannosyltransferase